MPAAAFASPFPLTVRKRHRATTPRVSSTRRFAFHACHSDDSKPVPIEPAPLTRRESIPSLFRGPQAVLGIVLAAAALLIDFSRNIATLISQPRPALKGPNDLDERIALLSSALDASKAALAETETQLDDSLARASSAEAALLGIGDTREATRRARENTQEAEAELGRITRLLVEEREQFDALVEATDETAGKREEFEKTIRERENEVQNLRELVAEAQTAEEDIETTYKAREEELRAAMYQKQLELESVRAERLRAEGQAADLESRAAKVADQAEAAEFALEETKRELGRVQSDLETRQKEREVVEAENILAHERSKETKKLRQMVNDMERELGELQTELRSRDQVVNEFAMESDELRSLLAARDVELREVSSQLDSAKTAEAEKGGDSGLSELSLKEIEKNLDAEKLAFSAEIKKAELASFDLTEEDLDPLDRIKREMGAEENLLQAGLRKAESTVRVEEHIGARKEDAVDDVIKSIGEEDKDGENERETRGWKLESDQSEGSDTTGDQSTEQEEINKELHRANDLPASQGQMTEVTSDEESMVARQAQLKRDDTEAKPKRRRGRPRKNSSTRTVSSDPSKERPKRKRGRPRKSPSAGPSSGTS